MWSVLFKTSLLYQLKTCTDSVKKMPERQHLWSNVQHLHVCAPNSCSERKRDKQCILRGEIGCCWLFLEKYKSPPKGAISLYMYSFQQNKTKLSARDESISGRRERRLKIIFVQVLMQGETYALPDQGPLIANPSIFCRAGDSGGWSALWFEGGFTNLVKNYLETGHFKYNLCKHAQNDALWKVPLTSFGISREFYNSIIKMWIFYRKHVNISKKILRPFKKIYYWNNKCYFTDLVNRKFIMYKL